MTSAPSEASKFCCITNTIKPLVSNAIPSSSNDRILKNHSPSWSAKQSTIKRIGGIPFDKKMNTENTSIVQHQTTETNNHPTTTTLQQQQTAQHLPSQLSTNRNGLPISTQRALLANVARFHGLDDFARDTCDKNKGLFGE
jgi:hypothetical protein